MKQSATRSITFGAFLITGALCGCGTQQPTCTPTTVNTVAPAVATVDHMSVAPGDQQQFIATSTPGEIGTGCAIPNIIAKLTPAWTVSDTVNVKISSAKDATNGVATCTGTTKAPVIVTATGSPIGGGPSQTLGTATLTCK